jgi:hypothetical protein
MDVTEGVPLLFHIEVENAGDAPAIVDRLGCNFTWKSILSSSPQASRIPENLKVYVEMRRDGKPMGPKDVATIAAGEKATIEGAIVWPAADDAPAIVIVAVGSFQAFNGSTLLGEARPMAFVLQSRVGKVDAAMTPSDRSALCHTIGRLAFQISTVVQRTIVRGE